MSSYWKARKSNCCLQVLNILTVVQLSVSPVVLSVGWVAWLSPSSHYSPAPSCGFRKRERERENDANSTEIKAMHISYILTCACIRATFISATFMVSFIFEFLSAAILCSELTSSSWASSSFRFLHSSASICSFLPFSDEQMPFIVTAWQWQVQIRSSPSCSSFKLLKIISTWKPSMVILSRACIQVPHFPPICSKQMSMRTTKLPFHHVCSLSSSWAHRCSLFLEE